MTNVVSILQDICLAEVAFNLLLSGDVTLPEMRPGLLSLRVGTLLAELHEGLFLSSVLVTNEDTSGEQMQGKLLVIPLNEWG